MQGLESFYLLSMENARTSRALKMLTVSVHGASNAMISASE